MTAFSGRRFSVFANQNKAIEQECERIGHTQADAKGRCYRCGNRIAPSIKSASSPFREAKAPQTVTQETI